MGLFGPSKQECDLADRYDKSARDLERDARRLRAEAREIRERDRRCGLKDPGAVRALTEPLERDARFYERQARKFRDMAARARRQKNR